MLVKTRCFGEIDLEENKVLTFDHGIMGFEEYKKWALLYNIEKEDSAISWLQSLEEPTLALPVIKPFSVVKEYNPVIHEDALNELGEYEEEDLLVLLALTVPTDVEQTSANMKAPFLLNAKTNKGIQVIVENQDYPVKFKIYEFIKQRKKEKN